MTGTGNTSFSRFAPGWRTLLSALSLAAALPPWSLELLLFVGLTPWLDGLRRAPSIGGALVQGYWLAFFLALLAAPWVAIAIREFLGASWPVAVAGLLVFAAFLAQPQLVVFAPLARWANGRRNGSGVAAALVSCTGLACAYTGLDALLPRLFDVGLGYGLHDAARLRQVADLGGVPLLTFGIVLVNLLALEIVEALRAGRRGAALAQALATVLLLAAASGYGELRNRALRERLEVPERTLRASLVQGNVANDVRLAWAAGDDRGAERQLSAYTLPTEEIIAREVRPDLVVWPEATYPGVFQKATTRAQRGRSVKLDRQVLRLGTPLVFGAYDVVEEGERATLFNALFVINPNYEKPGSLGFVQRYHKHALLPFSETLPGFSEGSWLHGWFPTLGFFGHGPGARVLRLAPRAGPPVRVSPIICSEALHPDLVAAGARLGSQLILNVGSDGWFGRSGEPEFHLAISRFRSVESRLPQIRAANTGISALILPTGEIAARTTLGTAVVLDVEAPIEAAPEPTIFTRFGYAFGHAAAALGLGFVGWLAGSPKV